MDSRLKKVVDSLKLLHKKGHLSPKLKVATKKLIVALEKGDMSRADEIAWLHQKIGGDWQNKMNMNQEYNEDDDFNKELAGRTAYQLFDDISHRYYQYG